MYHKPHTLRFLRQRKYLLRLPLLVLPFITIFFVVLGGGKGKTIAGGSIYQPGGINTKLPDAHFKSGKEKDKWGMYEALHNDSSRIWDAIKKDPYYQLEDSESPKPKSVHVIIPNEEKVNSKLAELQTILNQKSIPDPPAPDIQKMPVYKKPPTTRDPEMDQISGVLDKVFAIQHPELVSDSAHQHLLKNNAETFEIDQRPVDPVISGWSADSSQENSFYELADEKFTGKPSQILEAIIPEPVSLVSGSTLKIKLKNNITIKNIPIPAGQLIYGIATFSNERLHIHVSSVRSDREILPVSLDVYDMDGLEGIYIPGSITRDAGKQTADQTISSIGIGSVDPSVGAQAASAGIQAAKTLFGKKLKRIQVSIQAGYRVLLKDSHQN